MILLRLPDANLMEERPDCMKKVINYQSVMVIKKMDLVMNKTSSTCKTILVKKAKMTLEVMVGHRPIGKSKANTHLKMVQFTMASGWVVSVMVMVSSSGLMGLAMKENGYITRLMDAECSIMWMETFSMANGSKIKLMALALTST